MNRNQLIAVCVAGICLFSLRSAFAKESQVYNEITNSGQTYSGERRLEMAAEYLDLGGEEGKAEATKLLRSISIDEQEEYVFQAYMMLGKIQKMIREEYPDVTDEELSKTHDCIGKALIDRGEVDRGIEALIREAQCFSGPAGIMLEIIYKNDIEGYPHKDKRILNHFEQAAQEGDFRSLYFLGQIYLNGWGVEKDIEKGNGYLELSQWQERGFP